MIIAIGLHQSADPTAGGATGANRGRGGGGEGGGGRGWGRGRGGPEKNEKNCYMLFGPFGGRDVFHRVGHELFIQHGRILSSGDGLGADLRGFLVFMTSEHDKHAYNHCFPGSPIPGTIPCAPPSPQNAPRLFNCSLQLIGFIEARFQDSRKSLAVS